MACLCHQPVTSTLSVSPFMKDIQINRKEKKQRKPIKPYKQEKRRNHKKTIKQQGEKPQEEIR